MLVAYLRLQMSNSVHGELEKSSLSRGLSEAVEQLMQLVVRDCIIVWIHDVTSDNARIRQLLMLVRSTTIFSLSVI